MLISTGPALNGVLAEGTVPRGASPDHPRGARSTCPARACVYATRDPPACAVTWLFVERLNLVAMGTVGIPVKLLHEAVGHVITIELKGGSSYRGRLFDGMLYC